MRLSVLDQSPVPEGASPGDALHNSIDLAVHADRLGYHRYWVAEHHNMEGLAGSSPEILIGQIAAATERIRVGSGGVMLSHYSPYKVAENFRVLDALHPGRIDLGLGRAPGSDQRTAHALARGGVPLSVEYYPSLVQEVLHFLYDELPADHALGGVRARPLGTTHPEVWLLASSADSAGLAAHIGLPLGWAHFIAGGGAEVVTAYRAQYRPSSHWPDPAVSLGVAVICADTQAEADRLAASLRSWRAAGLRGPIPATDTVDSTDEEPIAVRAAGPDKPLIAGPPARVHEELRALAATYGSDELMIVTICHSHAARVRSYELVADAFGIG